MIKISTTRDTFSRATDTAAQVHGHPHDYARQTIHIYDRYLIINVIETHIHAPEATIVICTGDTSLPTDR
jgi:hypothetical protein